jgi:hypothetical protein
MSRIRIASRAASAFALVAALALPGGHARASDQVQSLLQRADAFRLAAGSAQVLTQVEVQVGGKPDKERQYLVYTRPGRRSLVLSRSPVEKGQKILMLGDDFWIVLPSSQRPLRITPAQKLLGDASTGDVATMTWAEDYDGAVAGEADVDGTPCVKLDLAAQRKGVTYTRVELYLAKADGRPVQADLYVASGRQAKRATFAMGTAEGRPAVVAMTLRDSIQTNRQTVIRYLARSRKALDDAYYNPMYLTHHDPE